MHRRIQGLAQSCQTSGIDCFSCANTEGFDGLYDITIAEMHRTVFQS